MYKNGDKVVIHSTGSTELDGEICTVIGIAHQFPEGSIYILSKTKEFFSKSKGFDNGWSAMILSEACFCIV